MFRCSLHHIPKVSIIRVCRNRPRSQIQHEVNCTLVVYVSIKCSLEFVINLTPSKNWILDIALAYVFYPSTLVTRYVDMQMFIKNGPKFLHRRWHGRNVWSSWVPRPTKYTHTTANVGSLAVSNSHDGVTRPCAAGAGLFLCLCNHGLV